MCIALVLTAIRFDQCATSVCLSHTRDLNACTEIGSKTNEFHLRNIGFISVSKIVLTGRDTTWQAVLEYSVNWKRNLTDIKMADIEAFLRMDKNFERITITTGTIGGRISNMVGVGQEIKQRPQNADYSAKYLNDQQAKLFEVSSCSFSIRWISITIFHQSKAFADGQSHDAPTGENFHIDPNEPDPVYAKYKFNNFIHSESPLPIFASQVEILEKIAANPVVVIQGDTGCGKSTQVIEIAPNWYQQNGLRGKFYSFFPSRSCRKWFWTIVVNEKKDAISLWRNRAD